MVITASSSTLTREKQGAVRVIVVPVRRSPMSLRASQAATMSMSMTCRLA